MRCACGMKIRKGQTMCFNCKFLEKLFEVCTKKNEEEKEKH